MLLSVYTYLNLMSNFIDRLKLLFQTDKEFRTALYNIMGFYPHDVEIYRIAFAHKSQEYKSKRSGDRPVNNERLEFLGDAVLETVVSDIVYRRFKNKREGFLTNTRSKIVSRESLGRIAKEIGLERLIQSHTYSRSHNSFIAGNAFEALMGAIYLDRGFEYAFRFIEKRIFGKQLNLESVAQKEVNFKSKLLEYCQKNRLKIVFNDKNEGEKGKNPSFVTSIIIEGLFTADGKGYSKKEAHQSAAREALLRMRREPNFEDSIYRSKEQRTAMEADPCFVLPIIDEIEADIAREKEEGERTAREQRNTEGKNDSKNAENRRTAKKTERKVKENTADSAENTKEENAGETVKAEEKKAQKNTKKGKTAKAENPESAASENTEEKPEKNQKPAKAVIAEKPAKNERQEKKEKPAKPSKRQAAQAAVAAEAASEANTEADTEKDENVHTENEQLTTETTAKENSEGAAQPSELPAAEPVKETDLATETAEIAQVTEETPNFDTDRTEDSTEENTKEEAGNNAETTADSTETAEQQPEVAAAEEASKDTEEDAQTESDDTDIPAEEPVNSETTSLPSEDTANNSDESITVEETEEVPAPAEDTEKAGTTKEAVDTAADVTEEKEAEPAETPQDEKATDTTASQQKEAAVFARAAAFMASAYADASRKSAENAGTSTANATASHEAETDDVLPISMKPDPNGIARPVLKERPKAAEPEVEVMPMEIIFDDFSAPLSEFTSSNATLPKEAPAVKTEKENDIIEIGFVDEVQPNDAIADTIEEPSATNAEEPELQEAPQRKPRRAHGRKQNATAFTNTDIILAETSHRAEKARKKVEEARKEKARKRAHKDLKEATRSILMDTPVEPFAGETVEEKPKDGGKPTWKNRRQPAERQGDDGESQA